jgi:polyhydroxyalkanoate synthesis repressor PhaR
MSPADDSAILRIRKYPNRRYYDATRRCHVTLDELHRLVRDGHQIEVTDSSGSNITNIVLTQIMLEHDPPKLDLFPSALLHQAIQANEQMIRKFIDDYFARAMDAFVSSRQQFDDYLLQAGLSPMQPTSPFDWARKFLRGFDQPDATATVGFNPQPPPPSEPENAGGSSQDPLDSLRSEIQSLHQELERLKKGRSSPRKPTSKTRKKKAPKRSAKRRTKR